MAAKTQTAAMLEALSDGRPWTTHELVTYGAGYAAHSRAADLRKLGYSIKSRRRNVAGENPVYLYELQHVPPEATRVEQLVDPAAAARLQAMRVAQGDSVFRFPVQDPDAQLGQDPEKAEADGPGGCQHRVAGRAGGPGVTEARTPQPPAAVSTPRAAAGPLPAQTAEWVDDLHREMDGIDDEIANLRSQLFMTSEDSQRIDLLLARRSEISTRLDGLERAA